MNDVIVGIDRSETARRAAETAAQLARDRQATLHLVMCIDRSSGGEVNVGGEHYFNDPISDAGDYLRDIERSLGDAEITRHVGTGDPSEMLCSEADRLGASTIVVGNRRVQGLSRVLGSVALDVIRNAPCDVLVAQTTAT